jgi:hypothetical protein
MSEISPNLRNTLFDPQAKSKHGIINLFFSNSVLAAKMPFFAWEGRVYKVDIPSCGCLGKAG